MSSKIDVEPTPQMRSTKAQRFLVWVGLTLGVSIAMAGSFLGESLNKTLGSVLIGFGFLIPSFWWMHCESEDRKNNRHYQDTLRRIYLGT